MADEEAAPAAPGNEDPPQDAEAAEIPPATENPEEPPVTDEAPPEPSDPADEGDKEAAPAGEEDGTPPPDVPPAADDTETPPTPPTETEKKKPEKKDSARRVFDSKGSLLESDSFIRKKLEELKKKRDAVAQLMTEIQQKMDEIKSKRESTAEDYMNLKQYHSDFMDKLAEYADISTQLEQLIGMPEVPASKLDLKMSVPSALKPPKKEKTEKPEVPLLDDSLDDKLPKIIVCGTDTTDAIPRIIVCEPLRKADLEPFSKTGKKEQGDSGARPVGVEAGTARSHSPGVGGKLNEAIENQHKLASENAKMARDRSSIQKELLDKQEILDEMRRRMLALESENRKVMLENEELQKRLKSGRADVGRDQVVCKRDFYMKSQGNAPMGGPCCQMGPQSERPFTPREITARPICRRPTDAPRDLSPVCTTGMPLPDFPFRQEITYLGDVPPGMNVDNFFKNVGKFPALDFPPMNTQQPFCKMDSNTNLEKELDKMGGDVKNIYCELDNLQRDRRDLSCSPRKPPVCKRMLPQKSTQTDVDKECEILFASEKDPKLKDLREQYKRLHNDFKNKVSEVAALRVDLDKTKTELESLTIIHHELEAMHQKELDQNNALNGEKKQAQAYKDQLLDMEQQANLAKQMYKSCQDEMEETRSLIEEQASQLDDYRNKYMRTLQIAEELKRANEFKERECADQLAVEIQKVKQEMQEQLEELTPIKDLLKITQQKLTETEQMHNVALETIADMSQRMDEATKELDALKSQKKNDFDGEAAANLAMSLEAAERRLSELENENTKYKEVVANLEGVGATRKQQLEERAQEMLQLESQLETLREESARQVARVKERSDMIKKCLQAQIAEMEKEVAQSRAASAFANRERDEIRSKLQLEIVLLSDNFRESQNRIVQLQQHVNYLNAAHPTSLLNLIK